MAWRRTIGCALGLWMAFLAHVAPAVAQIENFDIVLSGGRVLDPESGLDAIRNVGLREGTIRAVTERSIQGRTTLDVSGLVVAPGFIDLHEHAHDPESYELQVMDGVTTSFELELGSSDVDGWYAEREEKTILNYGVSAGHTRVRMQVMGDPGSLVPSGVAAHERASAAQLKEIKQGVRDGLEEGAVAVGLIIQLTHGATHQEILELFRLAAEFQALCFVHIRYQGESGSAGAAAGLAEAIAAAAVTGAPLHIVHLTSNGLGATPDLLVTIEEARRRGLDITTELYPYTAASNPITSAMLDPGWQERLGIGYGDLQWVATGERLNETSFKRYRQSGGFVLLHMIPESLVRSTLAHALPIIASDGIRGHPRRAGTFSRVLGRYVRESRVLSLAEAIRKMTWMPAQRLEGRVPAMGRKGRVQKGADADLTVFDPDRVIDVATYEDPDQYSRGIVHVLVNGTFVVQGGELQKGATPGQPVRAETD